MGRSKRNREKTLFAAENTGIDDKLSRSSTDRTIIYDNTTEMCYVDAGGVTNLKNKTEEHILMDKSTYFVTMRKVRKLVCPTCTTKPSGDVRTSKSDSVLVVKE